MAPTTAVAVLEREPEPTPAAPDLQAKVQELELELELTRGELANFQDLSGQMTRLQESLQAEQARCAETSEQLQEALRQAADAQSVHHHAQVLVHSLQAEQQRAQDFEAELRSERDRANSLQVRLEQEQARVAELEEKRLVEQQYSEEMRVALEEEQQRSGSLQTQLEEAEQRCSNALARLESEGEVAAELQVTLQAEQERIQELQTQLEELDLLREDLEETIIARRREVKALRLSEAEAREYAEEARAIREEAESRLEAHNQEVANLRRQVQEVQAAREQEVAALRSAVHELEQKLTDAAPTEALKEAERRHLDSERRLISVYKELEELRKKDVGGNMERLERRCLLLENDLKAANNELMSLERLQSNWEAEKTQLKEELAKLKNSPAAAGGPAAGAGDEGEVKQWKLRCDDLRETLRKARMDNDKLQERIEVLIKAKELEEKQRKEVESRLRTALRIQARQQGGF